MRTLCNIDDPATGDALVIEHDAATDRLFVRSRINDAGERCMVVLQGRATGLQLAHALLDLFADPPAPRARALKTPRKVAL